MSSTSLIAKLTPHQDRILKTLETIDGEISTQDLYIQLRNTHKTGSPVVMVISKAY